MARVYGTSPGAAKQEHQGYNSLGEQVCCHVRRGLACTYDRGEADEGQGVEGGKADHECHAGEGVGVMER